jgi:hypothetical protein
MIFGIQVINIKHKTVSQNMTQIRTILEGVFKALLFPVLYALQKSIPFLVRIRFEA